MQTDKKITIIGGSGFVGTNLCEALSNRGTDFEIIDIKQSNRFPENYKAGDVRNLQSLRATVTGDIVLNLAAVHRDDVRNKSEYWRTNVDGAENVAKICTEKQIRKIIFTSSVAVYGFCKAGTDEFGPIRPFNDYGKTKFEAEEKLRIWQSSGDNCLIIVRPTVIFGEGNRGNVFNLLNQIASGKFVMIGSGTNQKSMAYIGNVVAFLERCIETDERFALFNYVDTPNMDMNELVCKVRQALKNKNNVGIRVPKWFGLSMGYTADIFSRLTNRKLPISSIRVKKFCSSSAFASKKSTLDGFEPPFTLEEGIERTLENEFISPDPEREVFFTE